MRTSRESCRPAGRRAFLAAAPLVAIAAGLALVASAAELPVPCAAGLCGAGGPSSFVTQGAATLTPGANSLTINQSSNAALLNWRSFNIGAGGKVTFVQPSSSSIALNRIFQADPSRIFGSLNATGTVYLLNQNGFLFGQGAAVNVGGLLASSLNISADALNLGIGGAASVSSPAFQPYTDGAGKALPSGGINVQNGASIAASGGEVLLFAPNVENHGVISTPGGQTILGAGQRMFLTVSNDPNIRGLLIEVGDGGTVTNGGADGGGAGVGQIIANRGNVTLAGLAVNQNGRVSASTTTRINGSILLQARDTTLTQLSTPGRLQYDETGALVLGASSTTAVTLEGSSADTTVSATTQPKSLIRMSGGTVTLEDHARVEATSGNVVLSATGPGGVSAGSADASRIYLAPDSVIDVSGATVARPVSDNSLAVELRGSELANDPAQRDGPLRGLTVYVDLRNYGVDASGNKWIGTPLADLSGDVGTIQQDVFQRNLTGGTVSMTSSGSVIVSSSAAINISGGQIDWQSGYVKTSTLLGSNGVAYNIGGASPNLAYVGTIDSISVRDPHWGTAVSAALFGRDPRGTYTPGYVEGKDAGTLTIVAPALVLDGTVNGHTTTGPLQRLPDTPVPAGALYRAYDQVPLGGQLVLGNVSAVSDPTQAEILGAVTFAPGGVLAGLGNGSGGAFNPLTDALPAGFVTQLRPSLLGPDGVAGLAVYAEREITVPAGVTLAAGPGGSVVLAAGRVYLDGGIDAPGGAVNLLSLPTLAYNGAVGLPLPGIYAAPGASIQTAGEWINDTLSAGSGQGQPLFTQGGSVGISTREGSLVLPAGVVIDVSGGAQRTAAGAVLAGRGGSITIDSEPGVYLAAPGLVTEFAPTLRGFALANGGRLSIALPDVCVSNGACPDPAAIRLAPSLLTDDGFASLALASTAAGLEVAGDVAVHVSQLNWQLDAQSETAPSAGSLAGLVRTTQLPDYLRAPASLTLSTSTPSAAIALRYSDLTIDQGARLELDPLGSLTLRTDSRIIDNGALIAPGGQVTLQIAGVISPPALHADQAVWLGPDALVDVSGTVIYQPNALGLRQGTVLPGGSISLQADAGYLIALPGSTLAANGTAGVLDLRTSTSSTAYRAFDVASSGGSIALFGSEGIQFDATMHAAAGAGGTATGAGASGGSLSVTLDGDLGTGALRLASSYPLTPRVLTVTASETPTVIGEGQSVPDSLNGQGRIAASLITQGGFDRIALAADDLLATSGGAPAAVAVGTVAFESGVTLAPRTSLVVSAGEIRGLGLGQVALAAPYVALGSSDERTQLVNLSPQAGGATLDVRGGLVDLVGAVDLAGFATARIASSGDLRAIGVQAQGTTAYTGQLVSGGALDLVAQQIYPTTLSNYAIVLGSAAPGAGQLTISAAPGTAGTILSAAGSLTLRAADIEDSGVIRAPFGSISMAAGTVNLLSGSVTSVSGSGAIVPFGETQGGLDWVYPLTPVVTQVYGVNGVGTLPPQKQLTISASAFNLASGAVVDISGGGDLQAFEFTAGTGGTVDVLSNLQSPTLFAVLPGRQLPAAPGDPLASQGFGLAAGSSVFLAGGNGLAPGVYTLLPARYALLPGAFLVKAVAGYADLAPSNPLAQPDGSVVMAGYRVAGGTTLGDTRYGGFDVQPASYALTEASYTLTSADKFFGNQAAGAGVAAPRLPADAGSLSITATTSANLAGQVNAAHSGATTRGGSVDFASTDLYVGAAASAPAGYVTLSAAQLDNLGAESLLLGGTRSATPAGTVLTVGARDVIVAGDATLSGQEVILAASDAVQLLSGATVKASGAPVAPGPQLIAPAGTGLVRVSTGAQQTLAISGSGGAGQVVVAAGATVAAPGSITFNSGGTIDFSGTLRADGASVELGSNLIGIGTVPAGFSGFALNPALIAGLGSADLTLLSPNSIEYFGTSTLALGRLDLEAPGLTAEGSGASLTVNTRDLVLGGGAGPLPAATPGAGTFSVSASTVTLRGGNFVVSGVTASRLSASTGVVAAGDGSLRTSGALEIASPELVAAGAFDVTLAATGDVTVSGTGTKAGAALNAAAGGRYSIEGASVLIDTAMRLPAGVISVNSRSGDTTLGAGAVLDVAGFSRSFDGKVESADGGTVTLAAGHGSVTLDPASRVDVSAGQGGGAGGALVLLAPQGTVGLAGELSGAGAAQQHGASLTIDAAAFSEADAFGLNAAPGFTGAWSLRLRGPGDLGLGSGQSLRLAGLTLTADQGAIDVAGSIDASSVNGSTVVLAARDDVSVSGSVRADATGGADRGGTIELWSASGGVLLAPGSSLAVGGVAGSGAPTASGTVWIRAPRASVDSALNADAATRLLQLGGTIAGARQIVVEGYQSYAVSGVIDATLESAAPSNPLYADAAAFMANAGAIGAALGRGGDPHFQVLPGIELVAPGDVRLATAWDLSAWRFGPAASVPGALTVRAGGSLYVDHSLSDGFQGLDPFYGYSLLPGFGASWSYRLVAGADLGSANPLAVVSIDRLPAGAGNVVVAAGVPSDRNGVNGPIVIRTGTGSIDVAAAGDVRLGNQASVIYTAGQASGSGLVLEDNESGFFDLAYPVGGGNVTITAGRDVVGSLNNQLYTDWLWRAGAAPGSLYGYTPAAWTVSFGNFEQGIGALGGGDLTVIAGRNVVDLGANVPTIGIPVGDGTPGGTTTLPTGSGRLTVIAGGDIAGGKYLAMASGGSLSAGGGLVAGSALPGHTALFPVLALGGGSVTVDARRTAAVETVVNPTLLPRSALQPVGNAVLPELYSTYTDASAVSITSTGGDVLFENRTQSSDALASSLGYISFQGFFVSFDPALRAFAPSLTATALSGNVDVRGTIDLWPSAHGTLNLLAAQSVLIATDSGRGAIQIGQSDIDPATLGTPAAPASTLAGLALLDAGSYYLNGTHAVAPVHGGAYSSDGQPDAVQNRIVALTGDVALQPGDIGNHAVILSAKQIDIVAGRDILDLGLEAQNVAAGNIDTITAGRDLSYGAGRSNAGALLENTRAIDVAGPGALLVQAGRNVNLQTSFGITTSGNLSNAALPGGGADISVVAGAGAGPQYGAFLDAYLVKGATYDRELIAYVASLTGVTPTGKADALSVFEGLTAAQQGPFLEQVLVGELRAGGRAAAAAGATHNDYTRAFAALQTLFPGSNPDLVGGQSNPYSGDLLLYFSRIYTLDGGNIDLYAPGGQINVGLAAAPSTFGISKPPSNLGIVAQGTGAVSVVAYGDVQVNQSRIFAADGGDILIWSTEGNIDAGRGAKTAISAPPPLITISPSGQVTSVFPAALTGSGIQAIATSPGTVPGDVDLFAPHGVVNANDAGIVAGNLTIGATAVLGANNISFSGTAVGVPVQASGLGVSLSSAANSGTAASGLNQAAGEGGDKAASRSSLAETALNWLDVFVVGLGEDACRPDDLECLRRQKRN